jgi:hypothetical protein
VLVDGAGFGEAAGWYDGTNLILQLGGSL